MDISNNDAASSPVAASGRRKSGRAVKAPEKFQPTQLESASAKRKRGGDDVENDASDIDEEVDASDTAQESAEEEESRPSRRKTKTTRKPAAKKPKVNGTSSHGTAPAVRLPARPKKAKRVVIEDENAEGLYAAVFVNAEPIKEAAQEWLERYVQDNAAAMTELVNFMLKAAGCDVQVTIDDINDFDNAAGRLRDVQDEYQSKAAKIEGRLEFVMSEIKDFFDSVYVHRYRDIDARIRTECIEGMGTWIMTLPGEFLDGNYLRYMGWLLSDEVVSVRHEVLKQLEKILRDSANIQGMHTFIERFRVRIVEMATSDADATVRASAVNVVDQIRAHGLLEPDDIDVIGKLIFDSEPRVRKALVGFFSANLKDAFDAKIEELGGEETVEEFLQLEDEENYDVPRTTWIRLKCLAEILQSYDIQDQDEMPSQIDPGAFLNVSVSESRFTLAAQVLYDKVEDLKDWEILAGYLLFDHTTEPSRDKSERAIQESFKPVEGEELILLEVLNAVVKLKLSQTDESDHKKKKSGKHEPTEAQENTARHLASLIPRLLRKYGSDAKTATVVLRMEHALNLGVFQELRQDSTTYANLLGEISSQFSRHTDRTVLTEAAACFIHALQYEELEELAQSSLQSLWENTTSALQKLSTTGQMSVRGGLRDRDLKALSLVVTRLELLSSTSSCIEPFESSSDPSAPLPILILLDIIARGIYEDSDDQELDDQEDQVVISAIKSMMFYFMWKIKDLEGRVAIDDEIPVEEIDQLKEWQDIFVTNLVAAFSSRDSPDAVRLLGAGTVLDVYALFTTLRPLMQGTNKDAEQTYTHLSTLISEINPEVKAELTSFFISLEREHAKKSRKKLEAPADDEDPEDIDEDPEDEEQEPENEYERLSEALNAEKQLCELTAKLVLAILAGSIDAAEPGKGKLKKRLVRNKANLGPNFKGVLGFLEGKVKAKSHKSKAQQAAQKEKVKKGGKGESSEARVVEEDEEDALEDVEVEEVEEGDVNDGEVEAEGEAEAEAEAEEEDDDDIMGD
ncbi:putative Cohesin subunit psc3 [Glarea lozoyensis 74030]|uniref:Putative Cohesin subunit psc3 n=1 Tax=Glarea lozoyensis (strain ATCC 74030 / MF5533) TaxID=1104152 RepID=H0EU89_GLAL7|nr:putative Cohesin subunit psc3 [Glarea lozoyensis 74030]